MENWFAQLIEHGSYMGVFLTLMVSGLGVPIPEDVPLLIGGYLCGIGHARLWIMLPVAFLSVMGGDLLLFTVGRRYGHLVPRLPLVRRFLTPVRIARAEASFQAHGGKTLFIARFLPGIRAAVWFTAGTLRVPYWKLLAFDGAAALLSVPALVLLGWWGAHQMPLVREWAAGVQGVLAGLIVLGVAGVLVWKFWRRPRPSAEAAS